MERSGRSAKPGRSGAGVGRTWVSMWRRPSLPRVAHGTRLPGPPLRVGPVHRLPRRRRTRAPRRPRRPRCRASPASQTVVAVTATSPRVAACVTRRHSCGPPGSTRRAAAPAAAASGARHRRRAASPPSTPAATSSERASGGVAAGSVRVVVGGHPTTAVDDEGDGQPQRHRHRQPRHPAAGIQPVVEGRSPTRAASSVRAATPVDAVRQPVWRPTARHGLARAVGQRAPEGEPQRHRGEVGSERRAPAPGSPGRDQRAAHGARASSAATAWRASWVPSASR